MPKTLTPEQYLTLRNTVRILRFSGAPLDPETIDKLKQWEDAVAQYESSQEANG